MDPSTNPARGAAVRVIVELRRAGHTAYLAGGCVRDALLGLEPKDYDVATDARPEAVRKLFRRSQYVGEAFGVVLVYVQAGEGPGPGVEVATFRSEWGYEDGRRPGGIEFTDAEHDAQRRDFTVNGLFADPLDKNLNPLPRGGGGDRVIDYVDGQADLKAKRLRAIGDPFERFREDYLRMLRAARFASRLGFTIDPDTEQAIRASAQELGKISRERIGQEVRLMLTSSKPAPAAGLMQSLMLDGPTLGESHRDTPLRALNSLGAGGEYALYLATWMLDRHEASGSLAEASAFVQGGSKKVLSTWRKALCLSNQDRDGLRQMLSLLPLAHNWPELGVAKRKRLLASSGWPGAFELVRAVGPVEVVQQIEAEAAPLIDQGVAPQRWVTGDNLIEMGIEPGPEMGELLEQVYDAQLDGRVGSREEALAWVKDLM